MVRQPSIEMIKLTMEIDYIGTFEKQTSKTVRFIFRFRFSIHFLHSFALAFIVPEYKL